MYDHHKPQAYFLSFFCSQISSLRMKCVTNDVYKKLNSIIDLYDNNLRQSDKATSPLGQSNYIIFTKHCDMKREVIGYQILFIDYVTKKCEFFEVYVSEKKRHKGIASELIDVAINWVKSQGANIITYHLIEDDFCNSPLHNKFRKLKQDHKELIFEPR